MRRVVSVAAAVLGLLAWALPARAQQYPSRVVTLIVPYPAGGPTDQLARVLAPVLSEKLGQNFIVENVSGGGTPHPPPPPSPPPASPPPRGTATCCSCTICRSRRMSRSTTACRSTPRRTSHPSSSSTTIRWCWSAARRWSPPRSRSCSPT